MKWMMELLKPAQDAQPTVVVASAVLILALVAFGGLAIGSIKVRGLGIGIAGVLFVGLIFGHFHLTINEHIKEFAREFGLILFVYTIGMQVGPGFFASLRRNGLPLNLMAAAIVLLGAGTMLLIWWLFMKREDLPAAVGLLSGGVTNTPSLAAARGAMSEIARQYPDSVGPEQFNLLPQAYAVAYPFGIIGIISAMLLVKRIFKVNLSTEQEALNALAAKGRANMDAVNLEVTNPNLFGRRLREVPMLGESGLVVSRILRAGQPEVAGPESVLQQGDVLLAVGPKPALDKLQVIVGAQSKIDVRKVASEISSIRILVTQKSAVGKTIAELNLRAKYDVNVTRVHRSEIELPVTPDLHLQFADNLVLVGSVADIQLAAKELGNRPKQLDLPQVIPVFVGLALGVILGMFPFYVPNVPVPVKLGLAGGPLIAAIVLSWIGRFGPFVWYMPLSANFMLRELGICLFLACVGLSGGETFVAALRSHGIQWFFIGAAITIVPLLTVGLIGRGVFKMNYMTLCGLLAGSMTDPPALSFAGSITGSEAPSISYATVYPLTMLLRVLSAQLIVLMFMR